MANYLTRVTLPYRSGAATDVSVNDFSCNADDLVALADFHDAIDDFYTDTPPGRPGSIDRWLSHVINRAGGSASIKSYDRAAGPGAPPALTTAMSLGDPAALSALPSEVQLCMSFSAHVDVTANMRRRRGRIFFGPLIATAVQITAGGVDRPADDLILDLAAAGDALVTRSALVNGWTWDVWSTVDGVGRPVEQGYVDNAFDTQRRRGTAPSARTNFSV